MKIQNNDHQLRLFVAVARAVSLRAAADVLGLSQPALSKQIRALESRLGRSLFLRHGRGMRLTSDGSQLYDEIGSAFDAIDITLQNFQKESWQHGGVLKIATVHTLNCYFIPELVAQLRNLFPLFHLSIQAGSSFDVVESVTRGNADIGFVYDSAVDTMELEIVPLHMERLAIFTRAGGSEYPPLTLFSEPLILPPKQYAVRRAIERAMGRSLHPYIECNSIELTLSLIRMGKGATVLPDAMPRALIEDQGLRRVALQGDFAHRRLAAVLRKQTDGFEQSPPLTAALQCAISHSRMITLNTCAK